MASKSADLAVTSEASNSNGVELRRSSIANESSGNIEGIVVPHYRRASLGSCHDFCKYGHKHALEMKERHSMDKIVSRNPLPQSLEEEYAGGTKTSIAKRRASVDSKLMKLMKISESIGTKPTKKRMEFKLGESIKSEPQISTTADSKKKEMAKKLHNRQKQVKNEVPGNRVKPFIHPKARTSDLPDTVRQGNSSVSLKVDASSESTAKAVETSSESTVKVAETLLEETSKPIKTLSESISKLVKPSSKLVAKTAKDSSKSTAKLVKTSSRSTAKPVETSSKSTAKSVGTSSKSIANKVEGSSNSIAKKVEASSNSIVKKVGTSPKTTVKVKALPKSTVKKVEASPKSNIKKAETSLKSTVKKEEVSSKPTVKEEVSPKSTVKKVEASSISNSKVGASSKPTHLKPKQTKLSEKHLISSKSNTVLRKLISSKNPSEGSSGKLNSNLKMEKRAASSSKVAARKLMTPLRAPLPLKPSLIRVVSINARKHKSLKINVPHLKNHQLKTRRDEHKKPVNNNEVEEKTLYVIKMESGNKTLQSDQNESQDVELSPPQSLSPPKFSSSSQEDQKESKYTSSEVDDEDSESECMEDDGEALEEKEKGNMDLEMSKLKFKRGKLVENQSETTSPRKLKFRRSTSMLGENASVKGENQRTKFKRRYESGGCHRNVGAEKVLLRQRSAQRKKDALGLFNNVIEETANKLAEMQKSKVKALVGAFETVISLQERKTHVSSVI